MGQATACGLAGKPLSFYRTLSRFLAILCSVFRRRELRRSFLLFSLFTAPGFGQAARMAHAPQHSQSATAYLNTRPEVRYVGSKACASCHAGIYQEYKKTAMGRSMQLPSEPSQLNLPAAPATVHSEKLNRDFEVFRKGADLYQSEYQLAPDGTDVFRDTRPMAYAIGAGENGIGYLIQQGNYLFEAPLSYYTKTRSWNLSPGYEFADYGFHRTVPEACIICHSGRPRPVSGRPGLYKNPAFEELAIGCENCHGPGQLHVEERMKGAALKGPIDPSIVNPAHLPGWMANNVCMICHQAGDTRILQPGKTYSDFRPGTPLDRTVAIFAVPFTPQSPPETPLLQHYTLMILSKCYRASGGKMSCITCHDPHVEPTAAQAPAYYRKKCLECHTEKSCSLALSVRLRKSPPDDCAGCHMPRQNLEKISHSALTNHRIIAYAGEPFPSAAFHLASPASPGMVHVDAIPGKESAPIPSIVLFQAYGELMQKHPEYKPQYGQLLDALAKDQPHNPLTLSALGRRELLKGNAADVQTAQDYMSQAIAAGSTLASDFEIDSNLLARSGDLNEAVKILKQGIALNPYSTRLYKRLALNYIQLHDYENALKTMKEELAIFPEDSFMRMLIGRVENSARPRTQ
ncbi:MAG TPA: cytochrome c3 family protein [Terriglobia bacterium]|nr:cytochrome c3 family protein [Terriglobia bacterium]